MLGKLMRAEWLALWKPVVLLFGIMVAAGVAGSLSFHAVEASSGYYTALSSFFTSTAMGLLMLSLFCGFLVWAAMTALFIYVVVRFYRTMFTDQGYLTLTLPVTTGQLVGAKFLVALVIVVLAGFASTLLFSLMMTAVSAGELSLTWMFAAAGGMFGLMDVESIGSFLGGCVNIVVMAGFNVSLAFLALSLGAWWAQRHKVAAAVGVYLGVSWLLSLAFSTLDVLLIVNNSFEPVMTAVSFLQMLIYAGCAVAGVLIAVHVVRSKVDLS